MKKYRTIIILILIVLIIAVTIFLINSNKEIKNNLSKNDTFDRFIELTEEGEYEDAKKLTTENFSTDLSLIKGIRISNLKKDYDLSSENKFVYVNVEEIGYYKVTTQYCFELKETKTGWKINNFFDIVEDNSEDVNELI